MYPMKIAFERAALAMRTSEHGRAAFAWQLTQRRFAELRLVAGSAAAERARAAYEAALNRAEDTLEASDPVMLDQIEKHLSQHVNVLNQLLTTVPSQAQPGIQRALDRAAAAEDRVHGRSESAPGRTKSRRTSRTNGNPR
jgi:Fic family protein